MNRIYTKFTIVLIGIILSLSIAAQAQTLRVMLVPSDGGTEDGTREDWQPLFDILSKRTGFSFHIGVGQSYSTVVEAIAAGRIDIAYMGTVSFLTARQRGPVEMLAIGEMDGGAIYYAGLFTLKDSGIETVEDIKDRSLALTDPSSSSGFVYPVNILLRYGLDPVRDIRRLQITGSHVNSLMSLIQGHVDVAAAPFESYIRAAQQGIVDPRKIRIIAKSDPIPNPPLVISGRVDAEIRKKLAQELNGLHKLDEVKPEMLRGHAGRFVERYNSDVPESVYELALENMERIDMPMREAIIRKASERVRK